MHVSEVTMLIINLHNTAKDHKEHCSHNCNVSLFQLYWAANKLYEQNIIPDGEEQRLVCKILEEMKDIH